MIKITVRIEVFVRLLALLIVATTSSCNDSPMQIDSESLASEVKHIRKESQLRAVPSTDHIARISTHLSFACRSTDSYSQSREFLRGHALDDRFHAILTSISALRTESNLTERDGDVIVHHQHLVHVVFGTGILQSKVVLLCVKSYGLPAVVHVCKRER